MIRCLERFEEMLSSSLLVLMSVVISLQVFFRYCVSYSLDWPEELGRYLFIASVYVGSSYAEQKDKHLAITILRSSGGTWCAKYLPRISVIVTVVFCSFMTVWGVRMAWFVCQTGQVAPAMQFPMWIAYTWLPLGMACMGIRAFLKLFGKGAMHENTLLQECF